MNKIVKFPKKKNRLMMTHQAVFPHFFQQQTNLKHTNTFSTKHLYQLVTNQTNLRSVLHRHL